MGVPTVALFGPTRPEVWFPYERLGPYRVLATRPACHPCDLHRCEAFVCLPELRATAVVAAVREVARARAGGA
jgi:ADP-heptose:LPS heptosyltransferase